jgi:type IV pilus assembly protein PilC
MERYKYRALNNKGRPIKGVLAAANENDLMMQLRSAGLELVSCQPLSEKKTRTGFRTGVKVRDIIQVFIHLEQMEGAGVPLLSALSDIRDTSDNPALRDAMSEIHRDVSDGSQLSEAMAKHPRIFNSLYVSLVGSGEQTGKMIEAYRQLIKYLKWVDAMQTRVRKATRYPTILLVVVVAAIIVMMGFVVPQIVDFIKNMDFDLPFATTSLIATSDFFVAYWWAVLTVPVVFAAGVYALMKSSDSFSFQVDHALINAPVIGPLFRKIHISRFCQTFGSLYVSGLPILSSIRSASDTVTNRALNEALDSIQSSIKSGSPLSEAFNASGEFPSMVIRMIKVGEDSGDLGTVLQQVSDFYTADVDEEVQKLIAMIEPLLTVVMGSMILWIAVGVFGPIYSSFDKLPF